MSDLAPFVAAVLRDKVVHDLQEEVARLKKKNLLLTKADQSNGTECYAIATESTVSPGNLDFKACGRMHEGRPYPVERPCGPCTLRELFQAKVYRNGELLAHLDEESIAFDGEAGAGFVLYGKAPGSCNFVFIECCLNGVTCKTMFDFFKSNVKNKADATILIAKKEEFLDFFGGAADVTIKEVRFE